MAGVSGTHSVLCMYNSQKCEVNVGSLQNIWTNKRQWASPFYVPTLSLNYDLQSTSDKLFFPWLQWMSMTYQFRKYIRRCIHW
jgi:hypothetical protein